ncbi:MAG TPA: molybdenum cofactor biosynthesis protein MoaE [Caulobacteraceae bacterium]|nr:molybdenum cofactor biosynthesis protein MoaE [Caulobacteraceae bacterium]
MTVRLTTEPFEPAALLAAFSKGRVETGAVVTFTGIARASEGAVQRLELEAYPGFTDAEIERMANATKARFSLHDVLIVHRYGQISPGEAIVFVATAAGHRRAAFQAADQLMDYLKSRAPFWKREHGPDGPRWIEPTDQDLTDAKRWD